METAVLAEVTRGKLVESVHRGVIAVVDREGRSLYSAGDPGLMTYFRSAAKPVQAVPVVESGAAERFGFTSEDLAIIASSHSGEEEHVEAVSQVLQKIGLSAAYLQCGVHPPLDHSSAKNLLAKGLNATVFHCACSGKHAGMLALARYHDWILEDYFRPEHPVQQEMLRVIADFSGLKTTDIPLGVDGCGVPVFAMPVERMAYTFARLSSPAAFAEPRKTACEKITAAMLAHPRLMAGSRRLASDLNAVTGGRLLAKDGAEGVFCVGVLEKGWGLAVKIADGSSRALGPVVIAALDRLGLLSLEEKDRLSYYHKLAIKNFRGEIVGEIRPAQVS